MINYVAYNTNHINQFFLEFPIEISIIVLLCGETVVYHVISHNFQEIKEDVIQLYIFIFVVHFMIKIRYVCY